MPNWKNIVKLSDKDASKRAAEFEAAVLAQLTGAKPVNPAPAPAAPTPAPAIAAKPVAAPITITVTENGCSRTYTDLAAVPLSLRQQITNVWLSKPAV